MKKKTKRIIARMKKIKRRVLLYRGSDSIEGFAFEYEMSRDGEQYIMGISMTDSGGKSYKEMPLLFSCQQQAKDFFRLCVRCAVTPIDLEYVYFDFLS